MIDLAGGVRMGSEQALGLGVGCTAQRTTPPCGVGVDYRANSDPAAVDNDYANMAEVLEE